jgi:hypothetical protein
MMMMRNEPYDRKPSASWTKFVEQQQGPRQQKSDREIIEQRKAWQQQHEGHWC